MNQVFGTTDYRNPVIQDALTGAQHGFHDPTCHKPDRHVIIVYGLNNNDLHHNLGGLAKAAGHAQFHTAYEFKKYQDQTSPSDGTAIASDIEPGYDPHGPSDARDLVRGRRVRVSSTTSTATPPAARRLKIRVTAAMGTGRPLISARSRRETSMAAKHGASGHSLRSLASTTPTSGADPGAVGAPVPTFTLESLLPVCWCYLRAEGLRIRSTSSAQLGSTANAQSQQRHREKHHLLQSIQAQEGRRPLLMLASKGPGGRTCA